MAVLVLQNKHTQPTQLPFLWSEPPADHAYWDRFKIVLLRWTSAFLGTCFGFISLFKNQEYMTTSGTERLSNAILDFPLAHESVLNTINYWIHRGFFWKAALTLFLYYLKVWYPLTSCNKPLFVNMAVQCFAGGNQTAVSRLVFTNYKKAGVAAHQASTEDTDVLPPACLFLLPRRWYQLSKAKFSGQTPPQHSWIPQASSIHNSYKKVVTG